MPDAPSPTDDGLRSVVIEERDADRPSVDGTRTGDARDHDSSAAADLGLEPDLDPVVTSVGEVTVVAADVRPVPNNAADLGVPVDLARWANLAAASLSDLGASGELQLSFVDLDEIAELNREHMGSDGPTDVLSFPIDGLDDGSLIECSAQADSAAVDPGLSGSALDGPASQRAGLSGPPRLLGDVVVCPEVAAGNAPTHAGTVDDEVALLVVHGVLHVLGYDHAEPTETERMRAQERELLTRHHWNGPVPVGFHHEHLDDRTDTVEMGGDA